MWALSQLCSPPNLPSTPHPQLYHCPHPHCAFLPANFPLPLRPLTTAGLLPGHPYTMSSLPVNVHQAATFKQLGEPHLFSGTFQLEVPPTASSTQASPRGSLSAGQGVPFEPRRPWPGEQEAGTSCHLVGLRASRHCLIRFASLVLEPLWVKVHPKPPSPREI